LSWGNFLREFSLACCGFGREASHRRGVASKHDDRKFYASYMCGITPGHWRTITMNIHWLMVCLRLEGTLVVIFIDILRQCFADVGWHIVQGGDA